jgi:TctA family transporter
MIFFEIFLGMIFGFILGLIPSLHINVLAYLLLFLGALSLISNNFYFLFSFAIAMTIFGIVPLLIFNIPTADNFTLNLGQKSNHSISPYIFGFLFGSFFTVLLLPLFYLLFSVFSNFYFLIFAVLFFVLFYLVVSDSNWLLAFMIVIFSGLLGVVTLKYNFFFSEPLLPCIFGLFALPALVVSLFNTNVNSERPKSVQEIVNFKSLLFLSFLGSLCSSVIAIVPSLSPGMAQVFPAAFSKKRSKENRVVLLSSTLISVILIYFFMAAVFRKSRLGFVSILLESSIVPSFSFPDILLLCFVFLFVISLSCFLLYFSFPKLSFMFSILPRRSLLFSVVVFSILLIVLVTNIYSIFLIFLSFLIGLLPIVYNKNKLLLMSYLIVPTILFYI